MIAKVVFDLPLDEPFDYLIPDDLSTVVVPGVRVRVPLGSRIIIGFVVDVVKEASVTKLKPIKKLLDKQPIFDGRDIQFANNFANYYACSVGEALAVMTRHRNAAPILTQTKKSPQTTLQHVIDGKYKSVLHEAVQLNDHFIIIPDASYEFGLGIKNNIGLRSAMFEAFTQKSLIIIIDEDNSLFKQEQSPMYETKDVLLLAQKVYGFDLVFISQTPTIELMHMVQEKKITYVRTGEVPVVKPSIVDLTMYKYLEKGMLSVPLRNCIQENVTGKRKTLLFLNRRGSFSVTRCNNCGHILKCKRCDSFMSYEKSKNQFICRRCSYHESDAGNCPQCHKSSWKSFGMGIEKLQKEISALFPTSMVLTFQGGNEVLTPHFDILIATQAVLRYRNLLQVQAVGIIDIDGELNRMDMRSSFRAWALLMHLNAMAKRMIVQTRNPDHHVIKAIAAYRMDEFYAEELATSRELDFSPFYHWAAIVVRSRKEKNASDLGQDVYNRLKNDKSEGIKVTGLMPDNPAKLRDQYRFRLMAGAKDILSLSKTVKQHLYNIKRPSGTIITVNIDP